ncbi:MAG TPA: RidA family protein [Pseudolabrys sp.]
MNSGRGVRVLSPKGAIAPTGTWSLGTRAGDFVFVAGMRGINPLNSCLVEGDEARIRQAFTNMKMIAESEGTGLSDCVRLTVFVTDMNRLRPLVNKVQEELWTGGPYPPRTIVEVAKLNQDDFFEVEGTFYSPKVNELLNASWVGAIFWDTYIGNRGGCAAQRMRFHGHRAIHRQ